MSHWIDNIHSEYSEWHDKWVYAQDHYEGEVIDKATTYLQQREQGESKKAFEERVSISDYLPLTGHVIDSLAGMLFAVEEKAERLWQGEDGADSLGDPFEEGTKAYALWRDCDGRGTDWVTKWKGLAIDIIVNQKMWVLIDGKTEGRPHASVKIINPVDVTDWVEDRNGRVIAAKLTDTIYDRNEIKEVVEAEEGCIVYTLDGWEKHRRIEREVGPPGNKKTEIDTEIVDSGRYHYEDRDGNRILPIYRVELPIRRYIAYLLAQKNNAIFNKESAKDFLEWVACFPLLNVFGDDETFKAVVEALSKGNRVLQNKPEAKSAHDYTAPSTEPAQRLAESLKEKIEMFLYVAYQQYSDSAREKTATEARQDLSKGIGAFLELLKGAVDEAENNALWRIEQVYYPAVTFERSDDGEVTGDQEHSEHREVWGQARVERSSDFMPIDIEQRIRDMKEQFFGMGPVPLSREALTDAAEMIASHYNIETDRDELQQVIEGQLARRSRSDDFQQEIDDIINGN